MRVTQSPICQPDIGELARVTGTVTVTSASLWYAGLSCLCSVAPEGKQGWGWVEDGLPKAISLGGFPNHQRKVAVAQTQTSTAVGWDGLCRLQGREVPRSCAQVGELGVRRMLSPS